LSYSEKARRYGLLLVVDAGDAEIINEVRSNIIKHKKDALLNSHTDITLKDDEVYKMIED
jgi:hypothetical protein